MKLRRILTLLLLLVSLLTASAQWLPDTVFGQGYTMRYIDQPDDYAGPERCTVVRKLTTCQHPKAAILYIHGYNDYFFQAEEGNRFVDSCYDFYALDLRKYGRSILPGQRKFQARDMKEYFPDIDSALSVIAADGRPHRQIVLMAHSTGGLITSYYLTLTPQAPVEALILNSPFLEWNFNGFMRKIAIPTVGFIGRIFPGMKISQGSISLYAESLLKEYHGEWQYNTQWKTVKPEKVEASWIKAISSAQKELRGKHPKISIPILLLHSDNSVYGDKWDDSFLHGDAVLNVEHIARFGRELGSDVTEIAIPGGLHDLALSAEPAREAFYDAIFTWLRKIIKN
ncbi:MAG: alpha/beta hydrolase [Muribaculaceae bacterium]|nr:alpha/beta hydrolase [Muribaculaceae bacterium]